MGKTIRCILVKFQLCSFSHELFNPTNPSSPVLSKQVLCYTANFMVPILTVENKIET